MKYYFLMSILFLHPSLIGHEILTAKKKEKINRIYIEALKIKKKLGTQENKSKEKRVVATLVNYLDTRLIKLGKILQCTPTPTRKQKTNNKCHKQTKKLFKTWKENEGAFRTMPFILASKP